MTVIATAVGNAYDHISYLVACPASGEAAAIDPFHTDLVLETARARGLTITTIINTHEHWDHAGRNDAVRAATGARIFAPKAAAGVIENIDVMLTEGDVVPVGSSVKLRVLETPGHTMTHISLAGSEAGGPYLLAGDTLFGAGVGNCAYGGHAPTLHATVERLLAALTPETRIYPGHDYLARNLRFTLSREPGNRAAAALLAEVDRTPREPRFTTLGEEREFNCFMRTSAKAIRERLSADAGLAPDADERTAFLTLRRLRDSWS